MLLAATPTLVRQPFLSGQQSIQPDGRFAETGGKAFFIESNTNLVVTNGTAGGTFILSNGFGAVGGITAVGDKVYLTTDTGVWRSDGTPAGPVHVLPMYNNVNGMAVASGFTEMGEEVYFYAEVRFGDYGLWKTDGTAEGTSFVAPVYAQNLTALGDTLFFIGQDNETNSGRELWKTDGTAAGTGMVKDVYTGSFSGLGFTADERAIVAVGNGIVFKGFDGTDQYYHLWSSDGTEAGTFKISSAIRPNRSFTTIGDNVYFGAHGPAGEGLWKSDGTVAGTHLIKNLNAWVTFRLLVSGDTLYFAGPDGPTFDNTLSASLWKSDGTTTGTVRVASPADGKPFGNFFDIEDVDGTLVIHVFESTGQKLSLWTSDGSTAGTVKIRQTFTDPTYATPEIGVLGSIALFAANDGGLTSLYALQTASSPPVPVAQARGPFPYEVNEGDSLTLHGYTTADPLPGRPLTYTWDLDNDGVFGETGVPDAPRGNETGTDPTFNAAGLDGPSTHVVRFRISDPTGYTSTADTDITIQNVPPTLNVAGGPAVMTEGSATYTLMLSATDPGLDPITQWVVEWGDGATQTLPGTTTSISHDYVALGTYGISIKAQTDDGEFHANTMGAFDATFGDGGKVFSSVGQVFSRPSQLALQPDGKILAVSVINSVSVVPQGNSILVTRYNPDGSLDSTFGNGGRVIFTRGYIAGGIALQGDGRIVVSGGAGDSLQLLRLLPDGSFDPSFGGTAAGGDDGGPGWVSYNVGLNSENFLARIEFMPDGDIVGAGVAHRTLMLARFNSNGSLDPSFGTGGKLFTNVNTNGFGIRDFDRQDNGKLLVIPEIYSTPDMVMRFNPDGSPDDTFDDDGQLPTVANSLGLTPEGRILLAGGGDVRRLNSDGSPDLTFGSAGTLPGTAGGGAVIRVLPNGKFAVAYEGYSGFHFLADGTQVGTFAAHPGGIGQETRLRDMVLQPDGAPVLYGGSGQAHGPSLVEALVRATPPGSSARVVDAGVPQLSVSAPATIPEGATYTLGLGATDPDGDGITEWFINWGDGAVQVVGGNTPSITHAYADGPKAVIVKASAIDGDRSISSVSTTVNVTNVPPAIAVTVPDAVPEGSPFSIQFSATDAGTDTIELWSIDWGDGQTNNLLGITTSAQHTYAENGAYAVTVSAADEDGTFAAAPVNATITNAPPTLEALDDRVAAASAVFQLAFTARDAVPEVFSGTIDWGDGSAPTPFAGSAATPVAVNTFTVDHTYASRGTFNLTVNLSDGDGGSVQSTVSVQVGDIVARAYDDTNGNGVRDANDAARVGLTALLDLDRDGALDPSEPTGTTDAFGDVLFDGVAATAHAARVVLPPNWHLSTPAAGFIDATPGTASAAATFGLSQAATVTGMLFNDANENGVRDAGEGPLFTGVRARRVDNNTTTSPTISNGIYRITGLLPGQYVIEYTSTSRFLTLPQGRRGYLVTVTGARAEFSGLDFGSVEGAGRTISGRLFRDLNGNGSYDTEPGAGNVTVYIDRNNNGVRDPDEAGANSNGAGNWSIPRLAAGTYRVRQLLPPGSVYANDPAWSREVTLAPAQVSAAVDLPRPYELTYFIHHSGNVTLLYNGNGTGVTSITQTNEASPHEFLVSTSSADDWVIINFSNGNPIPAGGMHINGLAGAEDTLTVIGTTGADTVTFANGTITVNGQSLTYAGFEHVTYDSRGGWDDITVAAGPPVLFPGTEHLQGLNIASGASAAMVPSGSNYLFTRALSVSGKLDLADNALIVDYAAGSASPINAIRSNIATGYNAGAWNGPGMMSSIAAATVGTAIGFAEATDLFSGFPATFLGYQLDSTAVLLRYTRSGDTDLDRDVDLNDLGNLSSNFGATSGKLWNDGDLDFDGDVDLNDLGSLATYFNTNFTIGKTQWNVTALPVSSILKRRVGVSAGLRS